MRVAAALTALLLVAGGGGVPDQALTIRGQDQKLHLCGTRGAPVALVASGDGGWVHLGPRVAEFLCGRGYFVVGLDSRAYLSSFTRGASTLSATDVPGDFTTLLDYAGAGAKKPAVLIGVSEGAALAVLAATSATVKSQALGVVGLGLPDQAELGWRFRDSIIYVTKSVPNEPLFSTADVVAKLAPLPIVAIHSTNDEFVPLAEIRRVMERAEEPKQLWLIEAQNHRFAGNEPELDRKLLEAIAWFETLRR